MSFLHRITRLFNSGRPTRKQLERDLAEQVRRAAQAISAEDDMARKLCDHVMRLRDCERRLDCANGSVAKQIDTIAELNDELTELRGELAAAEQERDEARAEAATPPPVLFTERNARLLRDRGVSQRDLLEAVSALISDSGLALSSQAVAPGLPADERLHAAGGAYHLHAFRMRLESAVRPRNEDA